MREIILEILSNERAVAFKFDDDDEPNGLVCNCDDGFLCEHRIEWFTDAITEAVADEWARRLNVASKALAAR
jgi:hypothetical protein